MVRCRCWPGQAQPDSGASSRARYVGAVQAFQISQVFQSPSSAFVRAEVFKVDNGQLNVTQLQQHSALPAILERDAIDACQQSDACRGVPQLHNRFGLHEVCSAQPETGKTKLLQDLQQFADVLGCLPHPEIDIAGLAGMPMGGQRIATDQQVVNAGGVE